MGEENCSTSPYVSPDQLAELAQDTEWDSTDPLQICQEKIIELQIYL